MGQFGVGETTAHEREDVEFTGRLTGVSGHAFGPHYADQVELWRTEGTLPMRWDRTAIDQEARHRQTLTP